MSPLPPMMTSFMIDPSFPLQLVQQVESAVRDALTGASHYLPRIGLFEAQGAGDVAIRILEGLAENVGSSLGRGQRVEQQPEPTRERLSVFQVRSLVSAGINRFPHPRSPAHLVARACGADGVDRQSRRRRREKRCGIAHDAAIGTLPAYPDVLHDVLRFGFAT